METKVKQSNTYNMATLNTVARKLQEHIIVFGEKVEEKVIRDVKKGHFGVLAVNNGKPKRFVVPLRVLGEAAFKAVLEQAALEFGFHHHSDLISIPCDCCELEEILALNPKSHI